MTSPESMDRLPAAAAYSTWVAFNAQTATLIWTRFNGMLSSNALLAGILGILVAQTPSPLGRSVILVAGGLFGLAFAWQWRRINSDGWKALLFIQMQLKQYQFESVTNPMTTYDDWRDSRRFRFPGDSNRTFTRAGIAVFVVLYAVALLVGIGGLASELLL